MANAWEEWKSRIAQSIRVSFCTVENGVDRGCPCLCTKRRFIKELDESAVRPEVGGRSPAQPEAPPRDQANVDAVSQPGNYAARSATVDPLANGR